MTRRSLSPSLGFRVHRFSMFRKQTSAKLRQLNLMSLLAFTRDLFFDVLFPHRVTKTRLELYYLSTFILR